MAATLTGAAAYAYGALPLTYLIAVVAAAFLVNTTFQFSKKIAHAGGFYSYVSQGLGPRTGLVTGVLFVLCYFMVVANAALFVGGVFVPGVVSQLGGISLPTWVWAPFTVGIYLVVVVLALGGIRPSLRYSVGFGVLEVLLLAALSVAIIVHAGGHNSAVVFHDPGLAKGGITGLGIGVILAMFSMSGSSAAITLGEETRTPLRDIRRAVATSFCISAALFVLMAYALTTGWGPARMPGFASASIPGVLLTNRALAPWVGWVLVAFIINSLVAGSLAPLNSAARMLFAFARDGVAVPRSLASVNRAGTPARALLWLGGVGLIASLAAGWALGPLDGFLVLVTASSVALFVGHILANFALPAYFHRIRALHPFFHVVAPLVASVLVGFGIWYTIYPFPYPVVIGPIVVAAGIVIGVLLAWRLSPAALARAGRAAAGAEKDTHS
jgi:amino acid transporter